MEAVVSAGPLSDTQMRVENVLHHRSLPSLFVLYIDWQISFCYFTYELI